MGVKDSSLTRVQPAFKALAGGPPGWVGQLLKLASRAGTLAQPTLLGRDGLLLRAPVFEHSCTAPRDYLTWLIENPKALDSGLLGSQQGTTKAKRAALLKGEEAVRNEALRRLALRGGCKHGRGQWHVFEGATMVDCAIFCGGVTVFIEGKRTEAHLTGRTEWYEHRHQVVRNLDCLRVEPNRAERWYVLTVVEAGTQPEREATVLDDDVAAFRRALPHLNDDEVDEVRGHYAGYTTWQAIRQEFGLAAYPNRVGP